MLKKLLKYDLFNAFKFLCIFYLLSLFFALLTRIFLYNNHSLILSIIGQICSGATISMLCSSLINNTMRFWIRFKEKLYGDESYLTHTLPVSKTQIYLSKVLTTLITLTATLLVIIACVFIAYYSKSNLQFIKNLFDQGKDIFKGEFIPLIIIFLIIVFIQLNNMILCGFSGIITAHKLHLTSKTGMSVIYGFIYYFAIQIITLLSLFIIALFNKDILSLFQSNTLENIQTIKILIYVLSLTYLIVYFILNYINIYLLKKGVNVD